MQTSSSVADFGAPLRGRIHPPRDIDVTPFYLVVTSNLGGAEAMKMQYSSHAAIETAVLRQVDQALRPELVGRFDERCVFHRLGFEAQREICEHLVSLELARLATHGFSLRVTREAVEFLTREGHHPMMGVRPMRRAVEHHIQDAAARSVDAHERVHGTLRPDPLSSRLIVTGRN